MCDCGRTTMWLNRRGGTGQRRRRCVAGRGMTAALALALGLVGAGSVAPLRAQEVEQQKLLAKRAAEADAYRKLAEAVYGLQINSRTRVRDFVTESDEIRNQVDEFIRGIRLGQPTWYEDGSCEVPAEVTVARVVETLREVHRRHYKGDDVKESDFESITRRPEKRVIRVIGQGAPPPPREAPEPDSIQASPGAAPAARLAVPEIWRRVGPQARLMALRAARVDAQRRLAERIKGLRLTSRTMVRDFVTESDEIRTELDAFLAGAEEVAQHLHPQELIAEVTLRLPTEQVVSTIKQLHSRHYRGDDLRGSDVEQVVRAVVKRDFEETGMGVPPPQYVRRYAEQARIDLPEWATQTLEAQGQGTDPEFETPQGRLRAIRAAEMDARRKLAEQVAGLRVRGDTTVGDLATAHDHVDSEVQAVIAGATVVRTHLSEEAAEVTVAVPAMRIWGVVQAERRRHESGDGR